MAWRTVGSLAFAGLFAFGISGAVRAQRGPSGGGAMPRSGGASVGQPTDGLPNGPSPSVEQPTIQPQFNIPAMQSMPKPSVTEDETCLPWALSAVRGATVSVARLAVPGKARSDFDKACGEFKKKKWADAEQHFRDAIEKYGGYSAAWVMLGEVLQEKGQSKDAADACNHAMSLDATYLPPYLCLADLASQGSLWNRVLDLSNKALALNPVGDAYAYYYRAMAYFHLNKVQEAWNNASNAAGIEGEHREPGLYFLLAQIYEAEGDAENAALQLKQLLKATNDREQKDQAQQHLAKLEAEQQAQAK